MDEVNIIQKLINKNIHIINICIDYSKSLGIVLTGPKDTDYFDGYEYNNTSQIYIQEVKKDTEFLKEMGPLITGMIVTRINNFSLTNMNINEVKEIIFNIFKDNSLKNKNTITFTLNIKSVYISLYSSIC